MIFRSEVVASQWDTWCFFHNGTYYVYYLITETSIGEGFGVATSPDGVHWIDHGWAVRASEKMVFFLGTGSVWPDPINKGRFLCNYSEFRLDESGKRRQCILFAWSDDLLHWTKFGDEHIFWVDEQYYERYGRWDCISVVPHSDGGYFGTWTATPLGRGDNSGGIGFGESRDGVHWKALPPAQVVPDGIESGALTRIDGRLHAMFFTTGGPTGQGGMNAYVAESESGPYRMAPKNPTLIEERHAHFSRYFDIPGATLVNHHSMSGKGLENGRPVTYLAPFKRFFVDTQGIQRWLWWPGNEKLKGNPIQPYDDVDFQQGVIIEGARELRFQVNERAWAVRLTDTDGLEILRADPGTKHLSTFASVDRQLPDKLTGQLRMLARRGMIEVYADDYFMACCTLECPDAPRIRCVPSNKSTAGLPESLRVWQMDLS